jgi:hypothetical protein
MKKNLLLLAVLVFVQTWTNAQTQGREPQVLRANAISGITSSAFVIDNRSQAIAASTSHSFCGTGSGIWSVQIQYADGSPSGFVNFLDSGSLVASTSSSCAGIGTGYHDYIRFSITGTATVSYAGTRYLWIGGIGSSTALGGYLLAGNNLSDVVSPSLARVNLGLGAAATQSNSFFLQSGNNLSDVPTPATARVNLGITQANIAALWTGSGCSTATNALRVNGTCGSAGYLGTGLLQGYGMTGTGLDTPNTLTLADGTLASPSTSSFPASTWGRITSQNYISGLGAFSFYTQKNGGSDGIETMTISSRTILPSNQVSTYIRTVGSYGNQAVTGATNASPIVVTLLNPCYCTTGQGIHLSGVGGNTAANGDFVLTVISANVVSLNGSAGNGTWTSGGAATLQGPWNITGATAAFPIVITTDVPYNLSLNSQVQIAGMTSTITQLAGTTNWLITPITSTTFSLQGSNGIGGAYGSGGTATFFQTSWSYVGACSKFWPQDECTNEINTFNDSGVDAPAQYGVGAGLMNGWAIVGGGNAKNSSALYIDSQNRNVAVWQRGVDMVNGSLIANGPAYILPNLGRLSSYGPAPSTSIVDLMWQDSSLDTVFNTSSSGFMYFAVMGVQKGSMDNSGNFAMLSFGETPQTVANIGPCVSGLTGRTVFVNDSPTATYGATVTTGLGSNKVGLSCNGTSWSVYASGALGGGGGLADPGANGVIKRTSPGVTAPVVVADVIALWTGCSGTQYLGADGACHSGGGGGATSANQLTDFLATNTSGTIQAVAAGQVRFGSQIYTLAGGNVTLGGTLATGTVFWYVSSSGVLTAGHNSAATLTCSGCTVVTGVVAFPTDSDPLWQTTFTSNVFDTVVLSTMDKRSVYSQGPVVAPGSGISSSITGSTQTLSTDPTVVPNYIVGSGAPAPSAPTCTMGRTRYLDSVGQNDYFCDATNTWKQANGGSSSPFFAGSLTAPIPGNWSTFGSGSTNTTVTGAGGGNALQVIGNVSTTSTAGYSTTVAAGNFTHTFVLYALVAGLSNSEVGVGFTDGTKAEYCAITATTTPTYFINTISEATLTGGSIGAANGDLGLFPLVGSGPIFFQLTRTATALKCSWSPDGQNYFTLFNDTGPALTASSLIFIVDPRGSGKASTAILESYQ